MVSIVATCAWVGFLHSLAPNHWLPVALMVNTRRWGMGRAMLAGVVAALGHISLSSGLALALSSLGNLAREHAIQHYVSYGVSGFGLFYAMWSYRNHAGCVGHTHHGPDPKKAPAVNPWLFLFGIGFSPCVAVLPLTTQAALLGWPAVVSCLLAFSIGVLVAFCLGTILAVKGFRFLDLPLFEHYGDVLTGLSVFVLGLWLSFHHHH
jgi:hypothetical protein